MGRLEASEGHSEVLVALEVLAVKVELEGQLALL